MPSQEEFEDKFRQKFEDWEAPAPTWEDFQSHIRPNKSKKRFRLLLWWSVCCFVAWGAWQVGSLLTTRQAVGIAKVNKNTKEKQKNVLTQINKNKNKQNLPDTIVKNTNNIDVGVLTQMNKDKNKKKLPATIIKDTNNIAVGMITQINKDKNEKKLPATIIKDTNNIDVGMFIQINKDTNNINLPANIIKDSNNISVGTFIQINKDTNLSITLPTEITSHTSEKNKDSTHSNIAGRQEPFVRLLPILPSLSLPAQTFRVDTTWKRDIIAIPTRKWTIAGYISPIFTYKIVKPNTRDSLYINNFVANKQMAAQNKGYQVGLRIERQLGNKIGLYGGLQYQYTRLQTHYAYYTIDNPKYKIDSVQPYKLFLSPIQPYNTIGDTLVYHSLSAEIGVHYQVQWRRWESMLGIGVGYQYLLKLQFKNSSERYQTPYRAHHFTTQASVQIAYTLTPQKKIFIEPNLQKTQSYLFKGGLYDMKTYQFGWRLGVKWHL